MMTTKPLNKPATFVLSKSPSSMQQFQRSESTTKPPPQPPKKSYTFQFPTSPQPPSGAASEEIFHSSHPQHSLTRVTSPDLFTCSGCKEYGADKHFACRQCDFQLHEFCAKSPQFLKSHPLHPHHKLLFHPRPKQGGIWGPKCDICGKPMKGFTFRCSACSFQMHPCCAMLSVEVNFSVHPHPLKLLPATTLSSGGADSTFICGECKKKRSGRVYHCAACNYHLHAVCAKNMINGLHATGIKVEEKPNRLGVAARMASIVFVEFIGGLIEGFGEGVGDALVQNIAGGGSVGVF
ncbi:uncharacterized protein LOC127807818 isoform X2 [Diospyros lotus]|uniref:uncharacterized protein LOC127807818 isoform X2 n=1 Tax=Diospyros lotus TaxID=55363 RepID=UPI0022598E11|nr:uncharacterized protein LOC127807818 isoform X2 [Diospyros lotus]